MKRGCSLSSQNISDKSFRGWHAPSHVPHGRQDPCRALAGPGCSGLGLVPASSQDAGGAKQPRRAGWPRGPLRPALGPSAEPPLCPARGSGGCGCRRCVSAGGGGTVSLGAAPGPRALVAPPPPSPGLAAGCGSGLRHAPLL